MANYSVAEAKDRLPTLLNAALRGEPVTITRRGKPIANLTAVVPEPTADAPAYGSTAWLLEELAKLPPIEGDLQKILRNMRDDSDDW